MDESISGLYPVPLVFVSIFNKHHSPNYFSFGEQVNLFF